MLPDNGRLAGLAAAACLALCAGCSGGDGDPGVLNGYCAFIGGGSSVLTTGKAATCTGCSISNASALADADLATAASVVTNSGSAYDGLTIRVTAQDGIAFPAGSDLGFYWSDAAGGRCVAWRTYLDGVLQQDDFPNTCIDGGAPTGATGARANAPFDAVEVLLGGTGSLRVNEVCADTTR